MVERSEGALVTSQRIWLMTLVLLGLQASYPTLLWSLAEMASLFGLRDTLFSVDWETKVELFGPVDRAIAFIEVASYWIGFALVVLKRRWLVPFYACAAAIRFYFWLRFTGLPEFPVWPGYLATFNELVIASLIYLGFRRGLYR